MISAHLLVATFIAAATATESSLFATLLKRQEPGTPAYNCHDNCGTAITVSKSSSDLCTDDVFLFDYKNCLQCAGPDNYDIWRYYGRSLSSAAAECGLDTEPVAGKQDDVPEAMHEGDAAEQSSSATSAVMSSTAATAAPATTSTEAETTTTAGGSAAITTAEAESPTPSGSGAVATTETETPTASGSAAATTTEVASSGTGAPSASGNGTASYTSSAPPEFTGAGAMTVVNAAGVVGLAVLGAACGVGI